MTNAALIAKLEQAQEGSRVLSEEVLLALGWAIRVSDKSPHFVYWIKPGGGEFSSDNRPEPTQNLQDATGLLAPDFWWVVSGGAQKTTGAPDAHVGCRGRQIYSQNGKATTPALALSIAILKAVEAGDGS